jgi:hypothetical protein
VDYHLAHDMQCAIPAGSVEDMDAPAVRHDRELSDAATGTLKALKTITDLSVPALVLRALMIGPAMLAFVLLGERTFAMLRTSSR